MSIFSALPVKKIRDHSLVRGLPFWIAALVVGAVSSLYADLFRRISEWSATFYTSHPYVIFLCSPLFFLLGWILVEKFAPSAAGSGIPQVLAALDVNEENRDATITPLLRLRVAVVKIFSSLICLLGGGAIGREGPTLQISASIFYFIGSKTRKWWPNFDYKSWIVAGGAAGIASAFNTPLGGIVYAIEELSASHFHKFKTAALSAVIIAGVTSQAILGPYLYLGFPKVSRIDFSFLPMVIFVGLMSGLLGGIFGKCLYSSAQYLKTNVPHRKKIFIPIAAGTLLAVIYTFVSKDSIGSGGEINSSLLFAGQVESSPLLFISRFISTLISYLSGCAGGIFAPSLAMGASVGAELALLLNTPHFTLCVLLGMVGFLTGVTHCPFTSFVLILEMTDHHSAIFPLMLSALAAHFMAKNIDQKSFYEKAQNFFKAPQTIEDSQQKPR